MFISTDAEEAWKKFNIQTNKQTALRNISRKVLNPIKEICEKSTANIIIFSL